MNVLLCDDEPLIRETLSDDIEDAGHQVELASNGDEALKLLSENRYDCVVTDLAMPGADGMAVLAAAREKRADAILITGYGSIGLAVEAMRAGAFDFIEKPFLGDGIVQILARIQEKRSGRRAGPVHASGGLQGVVGRSSPSFRRLLDMAERAASSDAGLLIVGESGSGKEILARAIHDDSSRREKPFVPVSCGAISPGLLDDELFGHEKGAFTDAKSARAGRFEEAEGGTLFLDDIDDMRLDTQVKLLRVLQERELRRLGGSETRRLDIRVMAASKIDLDSAAGEGRFRSDLLYRIQILRLDIPPLRERSPDIPELTAYFLEKHAGVPVRPLPAAVLASLSAHDWPGNVRQLENAVCRALALKGADGEFRAEDFLQGGLAAEEPDLSLGAVVRAAERAHIERVLALHGGNRSRTAEALGISRKNLWEKIRGLGIRDDEA